ncbi:MAG: DnaD domain protein [Eubacteriales bacterium]|nr:DnaD domain protein [Eubacteriales bacterium]
MNTTYVKPENYIVIQGFMLTDLHLKGAELLVYATIYGFCQTEGQYFTGSLQYLSEWTNCTVRNVLNCVNGLTEKGLISEVLDEKGKRCGFTVTRTSEKSSENIGKNFREDRKKIPHEQEKFSDVQEKISENTEKFSEKQEKSSTDNIDNIIYNNYNNNNKRTCASDVYTRYENLIGNLISENIVNSIDTYIAEGIEPEMIIAAIDDAEAANVRRWSYVNKILLDKLSKNIKTLREYNLDKQQFEQSRIKRQNNGTPPPCDAFWADSGGSESYYIPDPEEKARYLKLYGGDTL